MLAPENDLNRKKIVTEKRRKYINFKSMKIVTIKKKILLTLLIITRHFLVGVSIQTIPVLIVL